ncbi:uncharacterized protein LOC111279126 [Durio zibethinus]|uniref:Uncharacterized protein LOC111279126 n=1 Tax=Durio zibethinus TaxID=66656 RepID=A0A6P5X0Q5_DURZI|nr:uncharacterized protein LOC111279126 [Durio zibethinus]
MNDEYSTLMQNNIWSLVPRNSSMNIVGCHWIYKIKEQVDGTIEWYKARLVAKGFIQLEGIDFDSTFSLIVMATIIRIVLSIVVSRLWSIRQLDVKNAFLYGKLHEEVYMRFSSVLHAFSFKSSQADPFMFSSQFSMKYLDDLYYFLGIKSHRTLNHLALQYLTFTKPNITYAIQQVYQFMHAPSDIHFQAVKRILRYLKGTINCGIQLLPCTTPNLVCYVDADWVDCPYTKRSTMGHCVFLSSNPIS